MNIVRKEFQFGEHKVVLETGRIARQATGAVVAQMGDLLESLMKRAYSVKDSGSLIPGHGGIFDRFDSFILVAPFFYFLLRLIT